MDRRKIEENIFKGLMIISTAFIFLGLASIFSVVVIKGLPAMNMAMITQIPRGGYYLGKEGGVLNAIIGSLYIAGGSSVLAFFIAIPVAFYLNIYKKKGSRLAAFVRFSFDVLWGVPSIVYGAFGFAIMVFFGLRTSLLGGIIAVTFVVFPIMARAIDEVIRMAPHELMDASYALGATKLETSLKVLTRQVLPGILTAVLVSFARGIGDAASVLFTAGFTDYIPTSLFRPAASLPLAVFFQLGTPLAEVQERAYASAFILMVIILIISIASRVLTKKLTRYIIK